MNNRDPLQAIFKKTFQQNQNDQIYFIDVSKITTIGHLWQKQHNFILLDFCRIFTFNSINCHDQRFHHIPCSLFASYKWSFWAAIVIHLKAKSLSKKKGESFDKVLQDGQPLEYI